MIEKIRVGDKLSKNLEILKMIKVFFLMFLLIVFSPVFATDQSVADKIIYENDKFYRKLIGVDDQGYFLIQDFYHNHQPFSSLYKVKYKADFRRDHDAQTSLEGKYLRFSQDQTIILSEHYRDGKKDGLFVRYFSSGEQESQQEYHADIPSGNYISWWRNGHKQSEAKVLYGNLRLIKAWYKSGQQQMLGTLDGEHLIGKVIFWHENANKSLEGHVSDGKEHGVWQSWYENGKKSSELLFDNGQIIYCSAFTEQGETVYLKTRSNQVCLDLYRAVYRFSLESEDPA